MFISSIAVSPKASIFRVPEELQSNGLSANCYSFQPNSVFSSFDLESLGSFSWIRSVTFFKNCSLLANHYTIITELLHLIGVSTSLTCFHWMQNDRHINSISCGDHSDGISVLCFALDALHDAARISASVLLEEPKTTKSHSNYRTHGSCLRYQLFCGLVRC